MMHLIIGPADGDYIKSVSSKTVKAENTENNVIIKRIRTGRVEMQQLWLESIKPTGAPVPPKLPVYKPPLTNAPKTHVLSFAKHSFLLLLLSQSADLHTIHLDQSNYPNATHTRIDPPA